MNKFQAPAANRARLLMPDNRASAPVDGGDSLTTTPHQGTHRPRMGNPAHLTRTTEVQACTFATT